MCDESVSLCLKSSFDILCVGETKLDASYLNAQSYIEGYRFRPFHRHRNKDSGGKMVFVQSGIVPKRLDSLGGKKIDTICIEVTISKKSGVLHFLIDHHKMTKK